MKQYLETGKIVGTHGVKGAVRVQPWCDSAEFLKQFKNLYADSEGNRKLDVSWVQPHGNIVLMAFSGIDSIEKAEALRNKIIYIDRDDVILPDGRYFIDDLIGCTVTDADSKDVLGILSEVSSTGANDVWHISKNGKEYLVPAIEDVIEKVDTQNKELSIHILKGIFDDED